MVGRYFNALRFAQGKYYNGEVSITSKLTRRGQTTLPSEVRKRLRASAGDTLEYELTDEGVLLRVKQPDLDEALAEYLGAFRGTKYKNKADAIKRSRESRGWDEDDEQLFDDWTDE